MLPASEFDVPPGYLDTASIGLPPRAARERLVDEVARWGTGHAAPHDYDAVVSAARAAFARLIGVPAEHVAVGSQVSAFVGLVAAALPAGAEVVAYRGDFTSLLFPFLTQQHRVRFVEIDEVPEAMSSRTALVAISAVQSADGSLADLDAIARAAAHHDALTLVDATQGCGWLPVDAGRFDFVVCAAYKWLLAPRGVAFMAVRPDALMLLRPAQAGWYAGEERWSSIYGPPLRLATDARRLDLSPAWLTWVGAVPALELLERVGVTAINRHNVRLANRFRAGLGMPPSGSAIVCVEGDQAALRLGQAGVKASARADASRASFHLYNDDDDVELALAALAGHGGTASVRA